jgi:hypothetical protein
MQNQQIQKRFIASENGQLQMCTDAAEKIARANEAFLHLVDSGMTKQDLRRCIALRPNVWQRYEHWMEKLPEERNKLRQIGTVNA